MEVMAPRVAAEFSETKLPSLNESAKQARGEVGLRYRASQAQHDRSKPKTYYTNCVCDQNLRQR